MTVQVTAGLFDALGATFPTHAATSGVELYKPSGLRRWWAALAGAMNGLAVVECVGDSTVAGTGCDDIGVLNPPGSAISDMKSWPAQLRRLFAATYGDAGRGVIRADDDRIALSGATSATATSIGIFGGYVAAKSGQSATWTLEACTDIDIHWWSNNSGPLTGTFEWSVDGGATTAVNPGTTANTYGVTAITGLADTAHTLTIAGTHATNSAYIAGVVGKKSTGVLVHRAGVGGRGTHQSLGKDVTVDAGRLAAWKVATFQQLDPAIVVIMLGHNDWAQQNNALYGTPTPTVYAANLQEMVTSTVAGGGCVLLVAQTPPPASQSPSGGEAYTKAAYNAAAKALADDNDHVAYLSLADLYGTNAAAAELGLQITESVHANSRGYGDIGRVIHRALTMPGARG